ncbi:MAG: tRNA pseudouridine(13) synthase TruD [Oceanicoccus sp.]|uniref:tRNA pseudouridine(13) synthase TruD n=1 Tax=Oceanicoccus sp. TaxID=2691044 RepID=UPI002601B83B|nr:tRNA pseudouridine(13) synthase TruD [Oceanicoccus sp.]MCP3908673.1 tRNA pseudouridine(13) synthase TruD [Oceanicoccus sp.]MDG1772799.1 tRNA pseudouridine(13) synthase TruD [Oceanicoccus sp.]
MPELLLTPLPYAYTEQPLLTGLLRRQPEDFIVEEVLGFEPEGEGEHIFLWIEKTGLNTQQVADRIARLAKLPARQISYSGMKDRNAVTRQWFSVHLPGNKTLDWQQLNDQQVSVLKTVRHLRKLRRGVHKANRFTIRLTELEGDTAGLEQRLGAMGEQGVPNYFGEQRFGFDGANLVKAQQLFAGSFKARRHQRGIYLSAARAYLFNQLLASRVTAKNWNSLLDGELLMLAGSHSVFPQTSEQNLAQRLSTADIHLTGPLYGKPASLSCAGAVADLEQAILSKYSDLLAGLEQEGLKAERRALRSIPQGLSWSLSERQLEVSFSLDSGCFATAVVRELANYRRPREGGDPVLTA